MIRNPAVADIHFRKDGQCDVTAQFQESVGEPLWKRPVRGRRSDPSRTRQGRVDGTIENVAAANHVKFVAVANAVTGERAKKVAELLGLLECCDVIRRLTFRLSQSIIIVATAR